MSFWRKKALELLPTLRSTITASQNVMSLWTELQLVLERAYANDALDEQLVTGIYRYAHWCEYEAGNADVMTAASVAFYEHLPRNSKVRKDLPYRLNTDEFRDLRELFRRAVGPEEYENFESDFFAAKERILHSATSSTKVARNRNRR